MIIRCDSQHFRVAMNGQHQLDYKHRMKELSAINQVEVKGDVMLLAVRVLWAPPRHHEHQTIEKNKITDASSVTI